ncbi:MAG TPA: tetratricopeptide repeat protein, partial [Nannocystis exedens]|nr:tetratricopeptide repeat protein [Nannocystis exedens]
AAARDLGGSREAHYFLSLALKALPSTDRRRFSVLGERESILRAWGRRRLQGADLRQMIDLASDDDDTDREVEASLRLLRFYLDCGRIQHAEQLLPRLRARISTQDDPTPAQVILGELHADLLLAQGTPREAEKIAREALQSCPDDDEGRRQRAKLLLQIGRAELDDCRLLPARTTLNKALTIAQTLGDRRIQADALTHLGEVARRSTRYQRAIDCFLEALEIDRELGDRLATGTKLANLGITYSAIGLHRRAERYLRKALELHEALGHTGLLGEVVVHLGEVVAELGEADAARSLLADAAAIASARGDLRTELRAHARQARLVLHSGGENSIDEASELATEVLTRAREHSLPSAMTHALHVLSCAAELRGDSQGAIQAEREAVTLVEAGAAPVDGLLSVFHLGKVLTAVGDPEGERWLDRAAELTQARLDDLQNPELRRSYLAQGQVQRLLQRDWRN